MKWYVFARLQEFVGILDLARFGAYSTHLVVGQPGDKVRLAEKENTVN